MSDERKDLAQVPYFVHEGDMARLERTNKRQFIIILVLIFALIGSNIGWIYYESQFEDVVTTTEIEASQDGSGVNIVGGGDVNYGAEGESDEDY